jgi:glutathione synthase/RimK-type ligase-like ATP-grasp enzyme
MKIFAYNNGSTSAKALAAALDVKRIKHEGPVLNILKQVVINWGASAIARQIKAKTILNKPEAIAVASNKLKTFQKLAEDKAINIPEFTTDVRDAVKWDSIVVRNKLTGHSGEGIEIVEVKGQVVVPKAPLYVQYIPKRDEFRVHVFQGKIIHLQQKKRDKDVPDDKVNWKVRNHGNGFIFAFQDVVLPEAGNTQAIMAVKQLGLDFGAVDLIYNAKQDKYYVLEVNTACGLEGTTLDKYVEAFKELKE